VRISYDGEADALYIELRTSEPKDSFDLEDGVTADLDAQGHVIGLEVLGARKRLGKEALAHLTVERLASDKVLQIKDDTSSTDRDSAHPH
jgi:uncharacterized protein YuzE